MTMPRFRRRSRRFRRNKREYIWVSAVGALPVDVSQTPPVPFDESSQALVDRSSWCRDPTAAGVLEKGCVVVRSILDLTVAIPATGMPRTLMTGLVQQIGVGLRKADEDDSKVLNQTDWLDEDWMQCSFCELQGSWQLTPTLTWVDTAGAHWMKRWDSKVKRKLTSEDQLRLSVIALASSWDSDADPVSFLSYGARFLLQLP